MNEPIKNQSKNHELKILNRNQGYATGIEKVISSCDTALNLVSACGALTVSGEKLRIIKYNSADGTLEFEGTVNAVKYSGGKQPLLRRIFK